MAGPWGSLSIVTDPFDTEIVTKNDVPLLNNQGQDTNKTIAGAVTIPLSVVQATLAATANKLWIQGGTTTDPILNQAFPGQYGFGALRCAIDNLNGDNVEWISYPTGANHVLCFAYYVKPPPTSGTIIVRKEVDAPAGQPAESFRFVGNISFNADDSFALSAAPGKPSQATFYRAGGTTWNFTEQVPAGWQLTAITCTSSLGTSPVRTNVPTGRTEVDLKAGDTVTCTYSDRLPPPIAGLLLRKITRGGVGTFDFTIDPFAAGNARSASATTTAAGVAAAAEPAMGDLPPGRYNVRERLPGSDRGEWALESVTCDGNDHGTENPVTVTLVAGGGSICTFANRFTPNGTIRLRKSTRGGTGTTGFVINSVGTTPPRRYVQSATTTAENSAVLARGADTGNLPLGVYNITETGPSSGPGSEWRIDGVTCNGVAVPAEQGSIRIVLTEERPNVDCTYYNALGKPTVLPETATGGAARSTPKSDLVLRKRPEHRWIRLGNTLRYFVTVRNRGTATAHHVTLVEQVGDRRSILSATPARYRCSPTRKLPSCLIGTLRPGQTARVVVLVRPRFAGLRPNRAVVNTSTAERFRRNNVARSAILVRTAPPRVTG